MDSQMEQFAEMMKTLQQLGVEELYGESAIVVLSEGTPGEYGNNPTVEEYRTKGYKLVDGNMFGHGNETYEFLTFVKEN